LDGRKQFPLVSISTTQGTQQQEKADNNNKDNLLIQEVNYNLSLLELNFTVYSWKCCHVIDYGFIVLLKAKRKNLDFRLHEI
jgi:hypothetical protein